ncbi:MAG: PA2779 family protein [Pseudomonadota bacterium]|jgi:hypothetical protein|nr:MAG: hypothetical protein DIU56_07995 [Pseudomonadota bacterium]
MSLFRLKQIAVCVLSALVVATGTPVTARAEIIDTSTALAAATRSESLGRIARALDQESVRERLEALGVDRAAIDARLAALTDAELASLAERLENAPAAGDVLGLIGAVFVVLLILELVGVIDIFKTVGPAARR